MARDLLNLFGMRISEVDGDSRVNSPASQKVAYLESAIGVPFTYGNHVRVLQNGDNIFPAMLRAIEESTDCVNFSTYVYWTGNIAERFADTLAGKAKEGVKVRVLLDAHGASKMKEELLEKMEQAGVDVRWFRPFRRRFWDFDKRTHRKLLICDKRVAFTGGVGIAREWEGNARNPDEWRETHLQFWGDCVRYLEGSFWDDWFEVDQDAIKNVHLADGLAPDGEGEADTMDAAVQVISSSPATHQSPMERAFVALLMVAQKRVRFVTPYFVLQQRFIDLLVERAEAGIDIEIMLPGEHIDRRFELWMNRHQLPELLEAGIKVWQYKRTMIHSKVWIIDKDLVCIGSPNINQRSRKKDEEVAALIGDEKVARRLDDAFDEDVKDCFAVSREGLRRTGRFRWFVTALMRPFREQL